MIKGVKVIPLKRIPDERGCIMHFLRNDDPHFREFGEIYFSKIYPSIVKGWHLHSRMTLNYAVVAGEIKLVLYEEATKELMEVFIGEANYSLVVIPPGIWNGFKCVGAEPAIVANCATMPHDPSEIIRIPPGDPRIPYNWEVVHR